MSYPSNPKDEDPNADSRAVKQTRRAAPVSTVPKVAGVQGGAPRLTTTGDVGKQVTETFDRTVKEYWKQPQYQTDEAPSTNLVRHAASPWKSEELDQKWGPLVAELERKLWDRYSNSPPETQAQPQWQQVGMNAQQAARSLVTRMLVNGAGVERPQMELASHGKLTKMNVRQWLAALPKKG